MNEHLFNQLIYPWIPNNNIPITLNRLFSEKLGFKRIATQSKIYALHLDIYIHTGYPCFRYCICKFFTFKDKQDSVIQRWYN